MDQNRISKLSQQMEKIGAGQRRLIDIEEDRKYKAITAK